MNILSNRYIRMCSLIAVLLGMHSELICQRNPLDTFDTWFKNQPSDSFKLERAARIAKYFENIDTSVSWKYYWIAKGIADKKNTTLVKVKILELEGVLNTKHDPAKAYVLYQKAIELCRQVRDDPASHANEASLLNNLGVISYLNGDYEGAVLSFIESVKIYEQYDISNGNLCPTLNNISTTYMELNYPSKALQYSYASTKYAEKYGTAKYKATGYIGMSNNLISIGRLDSGKLAIDRALHYTDSTGDQYDRYLCMINLGWYYDKSNKNDSALYFYRSAIPLAIAVNSPYDIAAAYHRIANVEMAVKEFKQARIHLDSARIIDETYQFRDNIKDDYLLVSEYHNLTGNPSLAVSFLKKYDALRDSLLNETRLKRIDFLEARYQSEKKEHAINELQKEQKIQQLNLRQKTILNSILIGSLAVFTIIGLLLYRNYRQKRQIQQQRITDLEKDNQLMAVDAMLKGQEEERSRLSKDLHDGLGGMLSGVKFSLSNMKDNLIMTPDNMAVFERSLDMIDGSIKELRRVAHNMMPEMLTRFGLNEALKEYCSTINGTGLLQVKYQSFGMEARVEKSIEIIIYRIVQELLNNILKHADATEAFVQVVRENNRLNVVVEDNGKGFDPNLPENNTGAGWINIRSRVDYLKGQLDIHSDAGKGTLVTIEFKLEE